MQLRSNNRKCYADSPSLGRFYSTSLRQFLFGNRHRNSKSGLTPAIQASVRPSSV